MKFTGTSAQLFQAIEEGGTRFQCIGQMRSPGRAMLAKTVAGGAAVATLLARNQQDKRIKRMVKREVNKAVRARQPKGLAFDLFG